MCPLLNDARQLMRFAGSLYITDDPRGWSRALRLLSDHALASDNHPVSRRLKHALFNVVQKPGIRRLFPLKPLPQAWQSVDPQAELIIRGHSGAALFFNTTKRRVTRRLTSAWQFRKARWIHAQDAVRRLNPPITMKNASANIIQETYISAPTVSLLNLTAGLHVLQTLWPDLVDVYQSRTLVRRLRLSKASRVESARRTFESIGRLDVWTHAHEHPIRHGLTHGDLKPLNVLIAPTRPYVIDWYETFGLRPPFFDVFYYLFWFARHHPVDRVVQIALAAPHPWEKPLFSNAQSECVHAWRTSLVAFVREMTMRLKTERKSERLSTQLTAFTRNAIRTLHL